MRQKVNAVAQYLSDRRKGEKVAERRVDFRGVRIARFRRLRPPRQIAGK